MLTYIRSCTQSMRYIALCIALPALLMAAASSSEQEQTEITTISDLQTLVAEIVKITESTAFIQESADARDRIQENMARTISEAASKLTRALTANKTANQVRTIKIEIAQTIAPMITLLSHNAIALGIIAHLFTVDPELHAQIKEAIAYALQRIPGQVWHRIPQPIAQPTPTQPAPVSSASSSSSSSSSSSARARREREDTSNIEFEPAKAQRTSQAQAEASPQRFIPSLQEMARKQVAGQLKSDVSATIRADQLRKRLAHLLPYAEIESIVKELENSWIKEHVDLSKMKFTDIEAMVQKLNIPIYIKPTVVKELAKLIAKEHFFTLLKAYKDDWGKYGYGWVNEDQRIDYEDIEASLPEAFRPYLTGISIQDLIDHGFRSDSHHTLNLRNQYINDLAGLDKINAIQSITELELSDNNLAKLPAHIFNDLPQLKIINLAYNQLTILPSHIFDRLINLERLNLNSNNLTTLPTDIFKHNTKLTELVLSFNQLTTLPAHIFDSLINLEYLYLNGNQLTTLPVGIFNNLAMLQAIDLRSNNFSSEERDRITAEIYAVNPDIEIKW